MKKKRHILISIIAISAILLAAYATAVVENQLNREEAVGSNVVSTQQLSMDEAPDVKVQDTETPPTPTTEEVTPNKPEELLPIPVVQFGPGRDWFRPTPPEKIQLASGRVQLFEFSAVW
jgi:hypothetical protein